MNFNYLLFFGLLAGLSSCGDMGYQTDTHSRGEEKIYIDESFKPLFETAIYTFEGQYPKADIVPAYVTEKAALEKLYKRQTNTICISRDLNPKEVQDLKKASIEVHSTKIAYDAVALLINKSNPDSMITVQQLKDLLTGKNSTWKSNGQKINIVFDNVHSANFNYLYELSGKGKLPENVFAVKSNEEVIRYVKDNPNALGIIGVNWISDEDDKNVQAFRSQIRQMWVAKKKGGLYFQPYQGNIQAKEYPLIREVWMLNKGSIGGLNTGFVNWMEKENGQLLIQKSGLISANPVGRELNIVSE